MVSQSRGRPHSLASDDYPVIDDSPIADLDAEDEFMLHDGKVTKNKFKSSHLEYPEESNTMKRAGICCFQQINYSKVLCICRYYIFSNYF